VTHVVQAGENLFRLSKRYNVELDDLAAANQITDPTRIYVGQELIIPVVGTESAAEPTATPPPTDETSSNEASSKDAAVEQVPEEKVPAARSYTVRWGDTLWSISRAFGVDVNDLATANNISNPRKLLAGSVLTIPN
jgi:LysM repeat protein